MESDQFEKMAKDLIFRITKIVPEKISLDDKIEDLCLDSIQIFELIMEFEKHIEKKLKYEDICTIETVGDIINKMKEEK